MELKVYNIAGKETGKMVKLNDSIFGIEPNDHAIYLDVKQFLAHNRQGTHKSKQRAEVAGSTKKLKRQKGTGTARIGNVKSPLLRGGGRAFGPEPRCYRFKLNKKVKELARKSALSYKASENAIFVIEDFVFEQPKTSKLAELRNNFNISDKKMIIVLPEQNKNIYLSSRNLQGIDVVLASDLATYNIMSASSVMIVESSIDVIEKNFSV